jgi:organic radical activating enzyme
MMTTLEVNEIFGPTFQGEGRSAGQHCLFIRLANCNLECTWCDTPYTWAFTDAKAHKHQDGKKYDKATESRSMTVDDIVEELKALYGAPTLVIISGGEPLMQGQQLVALVSELDKQYYDVHIETAGTIKPPSELASLVKQFNVSPKLYHSGNPMSKRIKHGVLFWFASFRNSYFKFVLRSPDDFFEVDTIVKDASIDPDRVMVMPEGTTASQNVAVARRIADGALERGYGLSMRTHILLWDDKRGR